MRMHPKPMKRHTQAAEPVTIKVDAQYASREVLVSFSLQDGSLQRLFLTPIEALQLTARITAAVDDLA
jgi:hypothetical protein